MSMTLKPREPKYEGMTVLKVGYINIADIDAFARKNKARAQGIISTAVAFFEKLIGNGSYEPQYFIPPVVIKLKNGKYELVAGEHRLHAHIGLGKTEIWVAIVEFENAIVKAYYQSWENKLNNTYFDTPRTEKDLINSAITVLEAEGYVDDNLPSPNHIHEVLDNLKISNEEASKTFLHEQIRRVIGSTKVDVQGYSAATGKAAAEEMHGNSQIPWSAALYKKANGESTDTDWRLYCSLLDKKIKAKNPALPYYVYAHWQKVDGEDIPTARKNKPIFWGKIEKNIVKYAKIIQSPNYVKPELKEIRQIEEDDE